jgi:hypothetical protein
MLQGSLCPLFHVSAMLQCIGGIVPTFVLSHPGLHIEASHGYLFRTK